MSRPVKEQPAAESAAVTDGVDELLGGPQNVVHLPAPVSISQPTAGALALSGTQVDWTAEQAAAFASIGLEHCPDADRRMFLHTCQKTGLDPFLKQIYFIERNDRQSPTGKKWTVQTGIDGFRIVAERSGKYRGQTPPQWCGGDGVWREVWLDRTVPPSAARIGVYKDGFREPLYAVALFHEYAQTTTYNGKTDFTRMWKQLGSVMISKCAEALAIRKAFPQDLSGIYTDDEMRQADQRARDANTVDADPNPPAQPGRRPTVNQEAAARTAPPTLTLPADIDRMFAEAVKAAHMPTLLELYKAAAAVGDEKWKQRIFDAGTVARPVWDAKEAEAAAEAEEQRQQNEAHEEWLAAQVEGEPGS